MTDWAVGDLALCVDDGIIMCRGIVHGGMNAPKRGAILRVSEITAGLYAGNPPSPCGCLTIHFSGSLMAAHIRLRKILPDKHEPCEAEFVTLLKRGKVKA